jgi:hypothetical protein
MCKTYEDSGTERKNLYFGVCGTAKTGIGSSFMTARKMKMNDPVASSGVSQSIGAFGAASGGEADPSELSETRG